jgi:RNA polymerase sigma-70 factor, ECF subfamily
MNRDEPSTSLSMLERVRQNDAEAWRRFCHIYGPLIYRWARVAGLQDSDAADVGQEVLRTVFHKLDVFDTRQAGATLRGWLRVITRNKVGDLQRGKAAHHQPIGGTSAWQLREQIPSVERSSLDLPLPDEDQLVLHRTLESLRQEFETRTWRAFWLATVDDLPATDIAEQLGMTATAVRQAKFRVLRRLRIELAGDTLGSSRT